MSAEPILCSIEVGTGICSVGLCLDAASMRSIEVGTGICSIRLCLDAARMRSIHISGDDDWAWG